MDAFTKVEPFCEGKINGVPEYFNSISALFILCNGYRGLKRFHNKFVHSDVKTVYLFMILNGISSFFCHWTSNYLWRMVDQFTMIFAIWYGFSFIIKAIYIKNNIKKSTFKDLEKNSNEYVFAKRRNELITNLINKNRKTGSDILLNLHIYNTIMIVISIFEEKPKIFAAMFGIESIFLIYFFFSIYDNVGVKYYNGERIVVLIGIYSIFISAFIWIITEIFCNKYLILGHSFWHIGVSYGVNNIIMYMNVYYNEKKCLV